VFLCSEERKNRAAATKIGTVKNAKIELQQLLRMLEEANKACLKLSRILNLGMSVLTAQQLPCCSTSHPPSWKTTSI
jgi:hypothetical protein